MSAEYSSQRRCGLPDGENAWLLEVKTRSSNRTGLLQMMEKYMCVCVQVLVQLFCSKRISAILMFYHLETKTANYFCNNFV